MTVGPGAPPSLSAASSPPPPDPSLAPTPPIDADVDLPADVPPIVDDPIDVDLIAGGDLTPLVPTGASRGATSILAVPDDPIDQIALSWLDGELPDRRAGLIVWQRFDDPPTWRAVYAFTDPTRRGVLGIRLDAGDLTRDGIPDLLSFEDVGGSGGCGTFRVIASKVGDASEIYRRDACDTQIAISSGELEVRESVFEPDDPHCCPSSYRTSILRWNGSGWKQISSEVSPADTNET